MDILVGAASAAFKSRRLDKKIKFHTCDETGNQQGQHQHLKHSHQQLSREGEELDIAVGHLIRPQGKSQDYACINNQM